MHERKKKNQNETARDRDDVINHQCINVNESAVSSVSAQREEEEV
jgi:hypothetical protein